VGVQPEALQEYIKRSSAHADWPQLTETGMLGPFIVQVHGDGVVNVQPEGRHA
jgi:hypothetical protein